MTKFLNSMGGFVACPPDVAHEVHVGFLRFWLCRDTMEHNGREGKLLYVHYSDLHAARWLFDWDDLDKERSWKTVENFKRDAERALTKKVKAYLASAPDANSKV